MRRKPYSVDAVLGNGRMLAALTACGEIQRLFWPHVDGGQHIERLLGGVSLDGRPLRWMDDRAWRHEQEYEPDQNLLVTRSQLPGRLEVESLDAVDPERDLAVRRLTFTNPGKRPVRLQYGFYQWVRVDENSLYNTAMVDPESDSLVHFRRDVYLALGADREMTRAAAGKPAQLREEAAALRCRGPVILHGDVAAAGIWDLGELPPGESVSLTLLLALGENLGQVQQLLRQGREAGGDALLDGVRAYWMEWLARSRPLKGAPPAVEELYRRSLLVFALMSDRATGAVIAAPEFDPAFEHSGGYAYCWGRDAAYITMAMDLAGLTDLAGAFYDWALRVQEPGGWWMHRHYATGQWGPSWGLLQVDETGSILFGMEAHLRCLRDVAGAFARKMCPAVSRAAEWLMTHLDPETGLPMASVDLWEERVAEHTYSAAAVYAGLTAAAAIAKEAGEGIAALKYAAAARGLRDAILQECVQDGAFLRGRRLQVCEQRCWEAAEAGAPVRVRPGLKGRTVYELEEESVPDSSLLGLAVPFGVVPVQDPVMEETVRRLQEMLWSEPRGGLLRYHGDHYRGGQNPWVLCTLWLGLYEVEAGRAAAAREMLDWAVRHRTAAGLLPEQVDPETGEPAWVVPLTWSHAMYVLLALRLYGGSAP